MASPCPYVYSCLLNSCQLRVSSDILVTVGTPTVSDTDPDSRDPNSSGGHRRRSARGEGDRLRDDLLDAAAQLMSRHGSVEQVSLRAVAREAGVSPTAVYRHFDDHLDLLRESVEFCWANFHAALIASQSDSQDPFTAFRACGEAYCDFAFGNQGQYRVLFSNRIDLPHRDAPGGAETFQLLVDLVTRILETVDDDREPMFVAVQVHTWIHGIVDLCGGHPDQPWPDIDSQLDGLATALRLMPASAV